MQYGDVAGVDANDGGAPEKVSENQYVAHANDPPVR